MPKREREIHESAGKFSCVSLLSHVLYSYFVNLLSAKEWTCISHDLYRAGTVRCSFCWKGALSQWKRSTKERIIASTEKTERGTTTGGTHGGLRSCAESWRVVSYKLQGASIPRPHLPVIKGPFKFSNLGLLCQGHMCIM